MRQRAVLLCRDRTYSVVWPFVICRMKSVSSLSYLSPEGGHADRRVLLIGPNKPATILLGLSDVLAANSASGKA